MNQHLQKIQDFIQQAKTLSAEEKAVLTKAIKDTDTDLTITEFKLDRTEKVKRTTAILLEETIEELEHKRKSVEDKNHELEIEGALERVRAVAMGMRKPDDMLDICRAICTQLEALNVKDIRNVQTAIIYEARELYVNYEYYRLHDKALVTEVGYDDHPIQAAFVKQMLEGPGAFFSRNIEGAAVGEFLEYQKTTNVFIDNNLADARSLNYYWYSMGPVALGLSTYMPLSQADLNIFERFRNVFGLAYTRYLDVEKALAQAREAQVQLALERVRARTMAMQKSEELSETAYLLFQQFKELGDDPDQITIGIMNEAEGVVEFWVTVDGNQKDMVFKFSIDEPTVMHKMYNAWKKKKSSLVIDLSGAELHNYLAYRTSMGGTAVINEQPGARRVINIAFFSKGVMTISAPEPRPAETIRLLERFAGVFDGTYTRFLDLKKAEAQTREAQIEAGLERVRSRTMAMQKSDELAQTAVVVFKQLINLGIQPNRLFIGIIHNDSGDIELWATAEDGSKISSKFMGNINRNTSVNKMYKGWKAHKKSVTIDMQGEELKEYFDYLGNELKVPFKLGLSQKRRVQLITYFSQGFIGIASPEPQPAETVSLMERFAGVFNLTYTRFNDLKIAEAHAIQAEEDLIKLHTEKRRAEDALINLQAAQKQLIQSEKMASLGELTAGIAHEIQNPLNFVNNFSEVNREMIDELEEELKAGNIDDALAIAADIKQNEEKINHHGKRADSIVKGMLQHSHSSAGEKQVTNLNSIADEFFKLSYHGLRAKDKSFNAELITKFDESLPKVYVIPQDIGRVMLNLFNNAFYAVNQKSKTAGANYKPEVSVSTSFENGQVIIEVKDNGIGIPDEIKDKIMQPFFTTKPTGEGTGLGLSLTYDMVVKGHGGSITLDTKEGEYSAFTISIPLS